ncbi:F-box/kelch-repeat protein At3g06240-like [Argentina anserina]|uniref:F-box/kelch-repeat protein At3g06240-like n=1 Tax=Argentina anserina TaxID=57926 RepID=UPI0021763042|nr:F-box/kelch-repeat protein At3g06240-like [Potentilla anserina]
MAEDCSGGGAVKRMRSDYFDEDIVLEILARLPVKSILRFRCVCKFWRALIAASYFVKKHLSYVESGIGNTNNSRLLYLQNPPQSIDYEALKKKLWDASRHLQFPVNFHHRKSAHEIIRVLGACNGLVCFEFQSFGIFICNPCTGDSKVLPNPPTESHRLDFYGFGYDSRIDDYKVVRGFSENALVHVFALKSGSWRTISDLDCARVHGKGCLFHGALHWLVQGSRIVSFYMAEEKFKEIVPMLDHDRSFGGVLLYKDRLCAYKIKGGTPGFVSVWLMQEYGVKESWTKVIHYSLEKSGREEYRPLCILQSGEILMHRILYEDVDFYDDPEPDEFDYPAGPDEFDYPYPDPFYDSDIYGYPDEFEYPDPDPDPFDDPDVFGYPRTDEFDYCDADADPDPFHDHDVFGYPDELEDPYDELQRLYDQQMWDRESLLVIVDQTTSNHVLEVDFGFGAAIYKETLVSPLTGGTIADI